MTGDIATSGRSLFVWMMVVFVAFSALGTFTLTLIVENSNDARLACRRSVEFRDDNRAMWLALFEMFPDNENAAKLHVTLDERLPQLGCVDNHLVPVTE